MSTYVKQTQELAVADMRLELDDEGRRELEEEQDYEEEGSRVDGRFDELLIICFAAESSSLFYFVC